MPRRSKKGAKGSASSSPPAGGSTTQPSPPTHHELRFILTLGIVMMLEQVAWEGLMKCFSLKCPTHIHDMAKNRHSNVELRHMNDEDFARSHWLSQTSAGIPLPGSLRDQRLAE